MSETNARETAMQQTTPPARPARARHRGRSRFCRWKLTLFRARERGMTTAEYAIGTIAAASFAGLLIKLVSSDEVRTLLLDVITSALSLAG